jgi:hypothetical protein
MKTDVVFFLIPMNLFCSLHIVALGVDALLLVLRREKAGRGIRMRIEALLHLCC